MLPVLRARLVAFRSRVILPPASGHLLAQYAENIALHEIWKSLDVSGVPGVTRSEDELVRLEDLFQSHLAAVMIGKPDSAGSGPHGFIYHNCTSRDGWLRRQSFSSGVNLVSVDYRRRACKPCDHEVPTVLPPPSGSVGLRSDDPLLLIPWLNRGSAIGAT